MRLLRLRLLRRLLHQLRNQRPHRLRRRLHQLLNLRLHQLHNRRLHQLRRPHVPPRRLQLQHERRSRQVFRTNFCHQLCVV